MTRKAKPKAKMVPFLAAVADPHVGNHARHGGPEVDGLNRRGRETVATFRRAMARAVDAGAEVFVVCGDLFHSRRPEPAVIKAVQDVVSAHRGLLDIVLVPGNHDMLDASAEAGNTAMAPLEAAGAVVVREPSWLKSGDDRILAVPFDGRRPMADHLAEVIPKMGRGYVKGFQVLATHVGLWDAETAAPWMRKAKDGMDVARLFEAMASAEIGLALVGNYHEPRTWLDPGRPATAIQIGTLCPATHGDAGLDKRGQLALVSTSGTKVAEIPGPRFVTMFEEDFGNEPMPPLLGVVGHRYYVRWRGSADTAPKVVDPVVAVDVEERGGLDAGAPPEVLTAETDEQAIVATVAEMDLPERVDRDAVREMALDCWRLA